MENNVQSPNTLKKAAYAYHTGLFDAFENWIEAHKEAFGRFTQLDAVMLKWEVEQCIMRENAVMLNALDFQLDGKIDKYETFEMASS